MSNETLDLAALRAKAEDAEDYGVVEVSTDELLDLIGKYDWLIVNRQANIARAEAAEAKVAELQAKMDSENPRWRAWEMAENSGNVDMTTSAWINEIAEGYVTEEVGEWYFGNGEATCDHLDAFDGFDIHDEDRPACEHCNRRDLDGAS